ncbi:unnamed protein product [Schistosoma margrebowiei]|uniref:Uncharacterized protein n=1 Tax=Schistosoma margrebowiei TaxID=48269 RepID=A0A3P8CLD7_9TREM|nr:unnamed protein product [Schistosoma margrebowiei]
MYISGQLGLDPNTMLFAGDDVESQTHQSLKNIREVVQSAGFTMRDVVKTTLLLADMNDFGKVNAIYAQYPYPARATYQVECLPKGLCSLKFHILVMNKGNRTSSQLWSILARAVKCSYREGKPKLSCSRHFETSPLTKKVFEVHLLEQPAEVIVLCIYHLIDENTLWLELVPRPVIHQSNDSLELPTIVSSLHVRIYKTLSIAKTSDSCMNPLLDVLTGFDNTGNVHLWSSEILLAHSMFFDCLYPGLWNELYNNFDDHPIENVCELCAGMTGAAGLAISLRKYSNIFRTSYVLITDGNDQCVASISSIIEHNSKRLLDNCNLDQAFLLHVDVKNIRWPEDSSGSSSSLIAELDESLIHRFDLIIAADCFFDQSYHLSMFVRLWGNIVPPITNLLNAHGFSSGSSSSLIAELDESLIHRFDLIIAADCFFDQSYHLSMLNTINRLLSSQSGSTFLAISPLRGNSLHNFINLAYRMEQTYSWTVKLIPPSDYLSSQFISYLIDESNRVQFNDGELDNKIGHLIAFTRTNYFNSQLYLFLVVGGFALFASAVYIRFYKVIETSIFSYENQCFLTVISIELDSNL